MFYNILLIVGVVFNVIAQIFLKFGMNNVDKICKNQDLIMKFKHIILTPFFWLGIFFYGCGFLTYSFVLTKIKLNRAYPISSITAIVLIQIASFILIKETISIKTLIGIFICIIGILFIFWK